MDQDEEVQSKLKDYIVLYYLQKALTADRRLVSGLRLDRFWKEWLERLVEQVEREYLLARKSLRREGCKVISQRTAEDRNVHVQYIHKGYEHHFSVMPVILKEKCEQRLRSILTVRNSRP